MTHKLIICTSGVTKIRHLYAPEGTYRKGDKIMVRDNMSGQSILYEVIEITKQKYSISVKVKVRMM